MEEKETGSERQGRMSRRSRNILIAIFIAVDTILAIFLIVFFLQL